MNRMPLLFFILLMAFLPMCREKNEVSVVTETQKDTITPPVISDLPDSVREKSIETLVEKGDISPALAQLDVLLQKDSSQPGWLYMKADALEKKGDTAAAIEHYQKCIRSAGIFTEASLRLANLYAEQADIRALKICDQLIKEPTAVRMRSEILLIKAIYHLRAGTPQRAMPLLDQIIREDYTFLDAYIEKGLIYFDQHRYADASKVFEKSTTVKNSFADGYYWTGRCEEKLGRKVEAVRNFQKALALDPSFAEAQEGLQRLNAN